VAPVISTWIEFDKQRSRVQLSVSISIGFDGCRTSCLKETIMDDTERPPGGFTGDPATALSVAGTGGCCGNAPQSTPAIPDPEAGPCCGTASDAAVDGSCCGSVAKADAVAAGRGCCG
jgi:hypothetical protein